MNKQALIIVGGGIAGLIAARALSDQYEVTILEASSRFGGRIRTLENDTFQSAIEGGAEFVHGKAEETIRLLKEAGIRHIKIEGEHYHKKGNTLTKQQDDSADWNNLMEKMASVSEDMTLQKLFDLHFRGSAYSDLRTQAITFAGGFDLADKDSVSVKSLYQEWADQSEDHRIEGGYNNLIQFLVSECEEKGCKMITNAQVDHIQWEAGRVEVSIEDQFLFEADKCLITVPLAILQKRKINFSPPISNYIQATHKIGYGTVIKVILVFKDRFWQEDAGFFFSDETIPTWWTQLPEQLPILTGWVGGPKAALLEGYSDKKLLEKALTSLAAIFDLSSTDLKEKLSSSAVFNWKKDKHTLGAYSYGTPESHEALQILNTPIENTLFFAGEALYAGPHPGTVEAAIVSAELVVKKLIMH